MDRIYESNTDAGTTPAPASPATGYPRSGAPGIPATVAGPYWYHMITESMRNLLVGYNVAPDHLDHTLILEAVRRAGGQHVTTVTATATLTLSQAGLVLVDATAGNITLTLPSAAALAALEYTVVRIDGSVNTVTLAADGAEAVGGAATITLLQSDIRKVKSDGVNEFHLEADNQVATQAETDAGTDDRKPITAKKLRWGVTYSVGATGYVFLPSWLGGVGLQWGVTNLPGNPSGVGSYAVIGTITFPVAFPTACYLGLGNGYATGSTGSEAVENKVDVEVISKTGISFNATRISGTGTTGEVLPVIWFAIGK